MVFDAWQLEARRYRPIRRLRPGGGLMALPPLTGSCAKSGRRPRLVRFPRNWQRNSRAGIRQLAPLENSFNSLSVDGTASTTTSTSLPAVNQAVAHDQALLEEAHEESSIGFDHSEDNRYDEDAFFQSLGEDDDADAEEESAFELLAEQIAR